MPTVVSQRMECLIPTEPTTGAANSLLGALGVWETIVPELEARLKQDGHDAARTHLVAAVRANQPQALEQWVNTTGWALHLPVAGELNVLHLAMKEGHSGAFAKVIELAQARGDRQVLSEPVLKGGMQAISNDPEYHSILGAAPETLGRMTPLSMAVTLGRPEWADLLLQAGVDVNSQDALGQTALHRVAAVAGNAAQIDWLIEQGADTESKTIDHKMTATMMAARCGDIDMVKSLFMGGGNINGRDAQGRTPLMHAYMGDQSLEFGFKLVSYFGAMPDAIDNDGRAVRYYRYASAAHRTDSDKRNRTFH